MRVDANNNNPNNGKKTFNCRSRPLTPQEQLDIMKYRHNEDNSDYVEPGEQVILLQGYPPYSAT